MVLDSNGRRLERNRNQGQLDPWQEFLNKEGMSVWKSYEKAPTIFNHPEASVDSPMVRLQHVDSTICYLLATSQLILYSMRLQNQGDRDEEMFQYCLNIDRYMQCETI
jgi:hypothetical protein